jgi:SCP-2 sterol transfer family
MSFLPGNPAGMRVDAHQPDVAERAMRGFRSLIKMVAEDPTASSRMALADTTVRIQLADGPGYAITLLLDRDPIALSDGSGEPQIALAMTAVQLEGLARGELALAMEIAHGRVDYSGPVRKFLRVMPILRRVSHQWLAGSDHGRDLHLPALSE